MRRIGLTQRVDVYTDRNERRDALDQAWVSLVTRLGYLPVALPNLISDVHTYLDALHIEGVIITGGNDIGQAPERDAFERQLLDACADTSRPVLGVCRGLQVAVLHLGGTLVEVAGHVATRHVLVPRFSNGLPIRKRVAVNSYHRFGLTPDGLGGCWQVLAEAHDGTVEAVRHEEHRFVGIMWHPERAPCDPQDAELIHYLFEEHA